VFEKAQHRCVRTGGRDRIVLFVVVFGIWIAQVPSLSRQQRLRDRDESDKTADQPDVIFLILAAARRRHALPVRIMR